LLSAVRADLQAFLYPSKPTTTPTGWWANKHAGQVGVSYFKKLKNLKVFSLAELNYVRPYTYSHLNLFENYGHHFAPLAHPLGANFLEVVHNTALQSKKLFCSFYISYFFKGIDQPNVSWGRDVNKSYLLRP